MNSSYGISSRNGVVSAKRVTPFVRSVQSGRSGTYVTKSASTGRTVAQGKSASTGRTGAQDKSGSTSQDKRN